MSPIHIHTASVSRGRGRGRGTSREQPESSRAHATSPYESDPEEDPSHDSYTAPPSPESPRQQYDQYPEYGTQYAAPPAPPRPDPALAAIHALLRHMVEMQQTNAQPARHAPAPPDRPDYPKTVMLMKNLGTPSFEGSTNPIDADHWRETLDRNFAAIRCPSEYKKDIAVYYLQRDAGSWWQTVERSYNPGILDYETFCREFERKYFPPEAQDRLEIQYLELTQGRGSVRDYEAEFTRLRRYAARAQQEDEASVIRRFIRGLRPQIRTHLQAVKHYHLGEVVEKAVNIEESLAAEQAAVSRTAAARQIPPAPRPVPPTAGQASQGRDRDTPGSRSDLRCTKCHRQHSGPCNLPPLACYVCGNPRHIARDCPRAHGAAPAASQTIRCYTCGEPGHYATSCPQRRPSDSAYRQQGPVAAGSSRPQLPPPPAKRPATAARVFALEALGSPATTDHVFAMDAPRSPGMENGPLTGEQPDQY